MNCRSLKLIPLLIVGLVMGTLSPAFGQYTFSLQATNEGETLKTQFFPGETFYLNIILSNVGGVAGCAFTLEYPTNILSPPATDAEGLSDGITSLFPFTYNSEQTHRGNSSSVPGKIYLAGAEINQQDGGSKYISGAGNLFRIRLTVKGDAPLGNFALALKPTVLTNFDAGYNNEQVAVLVGAVDNSDTDWDNLALAFPNLLTSPPAILAQTSLDVVEPTGSLRVVIQPQAAADAGAQWRRVGTTTWFDSGYTETNVPIGQYTIEFKAVPGWKPLENIIVTVTAGGSATYAGSYVEQKAVLPGVLLLLLE